MQEISDAQVLFRKNPRKIYLMIFNSTAFENNEIERQAEVMLRLYGRLKQVALCVSTVCLEKEKPASGTPKGNRTPVCAVKGRCPNR